MAEKIDAYDYFKLKNDGAIDKDIYSLGWQNVVMPDADAAYTRYGNNEDKVAFADKYQKTQNDFTNFQQNSYLRDSSDPLTYRHTPENKPGTWLGGNTDLSTRTDETPEQIAQSRNIFNTWQGGQKASNLKASDARAGTIALDYDDKGVPLYRFLKENESTAGLTLNSIFGPSEQYSSGINKMMSGLWNGSVVSGISGAGAVVKNIGDLGEAMYNGVTTGEFTASGTNPFDHAYNNILGLSKGLKSVNEDQQGSLWYDFNNGLASLLTAMAVNYGAGKSTAALGFSEATAGTVARNASLGVGSMQVMGDFTEQAKMAGIPDADIALMSPIMGAITWWTESKFGPDYVFNRYEQAGAKKLIQKEFIGELKTYAEKNGLKSMSEIPKSAYAKAINNLSGKLGKIWHGIATGEGATYNFIKGGVGEGSEEFTEQIFQQGLQKTYDAFKVYHNNKLPANKQKVIDKNYGLFYGKDFSLGTIYDQVTEGAGYSALLGGLTGAVANVGGSIVNKNKQQDHQRRIINEAIISGKTDELKQAITEAYEKDKTFPGANWTNGQETVTYDVNGNKKIKSIKDMLYEQILSDIDLQTDLYNKSGIANPDFIRNRLGGKKALAYSALDNITQQKQAETTITQLEQAKKEAQDAGTWTDPISEDQDDILKTKKQLAELQNDFQDIASGNRYSKELKSGLVDVYAAKNPSSNYTFTTRQKVVDGKIINEVIPDTENGPGFVTSDTVDNFNKRTEVDRKSAIELAADIAKNKLSSWSKQVDAITDLESSALDQNFHSQVDELLKNVQSYGLNPDVNSRLASLLSRHSDEQDTIVDDASAEPEVSPETMTAMSHSEKLQKAYQEFGNAMNYEPKSTFDENDFLLEQYFPARDQITRYANGTEDEKKVILANPNIIKRGGDLDIAMDSIKKNMQIATVNGQVYNSLELNHIGTGDDPRLSQGQYDMLKSEHDSLEQMINKIREESTAAVNHRSREQLRINGINVEISNYLLNYAVKIAEIDSIPQVISAVADLNKAMAEMKNSDYNEDSIRKAEKAITVIQSFLHIKGKTNPKIFDQIEEAIISNKRKDTGNDITAMSLLRPIEFLGANFEQIYHLDSITGQGKNKDAFYQTFAAFKVTNFFNLIRRVDMNDVAKIAYDVIVSESPTSNTPSYEQVQSVIELASFLVDSDNTWIKNYSKIRKKFQTGITDEAINTEIAKLINNSVFFRGFAGAGKTTTSLPLALKVYMKIAGLKEISICHIAPNQKILNKLQASTKSIRGTTASGTFTIDEFVNSPVNITKNFDITVLDEASLLSTNDIQKIKALQEVGKPIIFIGDQSQVSDELNNNLLPIEKMMERTTPMTASFRNSSADINLFAAKARSGIFNQEMMSFPNTDYNKDENFGIKYYKKELDIVDAVVNDIANKNYPWLIVSDDKRRNELIDILISQGVDSRIAADVVKYIKKGEESAQGDERPKVYVAIRYVDVMKNGDVDTGMYNRMMMTAATRAGGSNNNLGFAGILDESNKAVSKIGNPVMTQGIQVDREALLSKLLNMHTPDLHGKKTEAAPTGTPTPRTSTDSEGVGKIPTQTQLKKAIARIKKGEVGVVDEMLKHFKPTQEQIDGLRSIESTYAEAASQGLSIEIPELDAILGEIAELEKPDYTTKLIQLGWSTDDFKDLTLDDMKRLVELEIKKDKEPIEEPFEDTTVILEVAKKNRFLSGAIQYNQSATLKINGYAILFDGSISQQNIPLNKLQQAKIADLRTRYSKTDKGTVVIKYHPAIKLMGENGAYIGTNIFALYSDNTDKAVFLGVMSMVDNGFDDDSKGIDDIDYTSVKEYNNLIQKIKTGFKSEEDEQKRNMLIAQHLKTAEIKQQVATKPEGIVVPVRRVLSAQLTKPESYTDTTKMPTLNEFRAKVEDQFGKGSVTYGAPFQMRNTDTGFVSYGMKVSFLGSPENGITVKLRMDKMTKADAISILTRDGINDSNAPDPTPIGLRNAIYSMTYADLYPSRSIKMIDYNRSVLRNMINSKNGVEKFLELKENDRDIRTIGKDAKEQFRSLINFYELVRENDGIREQLYNMPNIWHDAVTREYKSFDLKDIDSIGDRIFVEANKAEPIHFPTIDIGTKILDVNNTPIEYKAKPKKSAPPSSEDAWEETLVKPENTPARQRITTDKITAQVNRLLGNSIGIKFSPEVYSRNGQRLYAVARTGYVEFEDNGGVESTTGRHEVLHQIMQFLIDPEYKQELLQAAKTIIARNNNKDINTINDNEAEEWMAVQYGDTEGMPPHPVLAPFYRLINNFLKFLKNLFNVAHSEQDVLNDFFNDIEYGQYYGQQFPAPASDFFEKTMAYDVNDDIEEENEEEIPELSNEQLKSEKKKLLKKYGNLKDYFSLARVFGTIDSADRLKPKVAALIMHYMNPQVIMDEEFSLIEPMSLYDAIKEVEKYYKDEAKKRVTPEFVKMIADKQITGLNVMEKLYDKNNPGLMYIWALHSMSKDKSIIQKYVQSIFKNTNVARLLETGNINISSKKSTQDTISKKENQLVDIADNRSDTLELLLNTVKLNSYAIENGVVVKKGEAKGLVDPGMLKQAISEAGKEKANRNDFKKLYDNLLKMATVVTNNVEDSQVLTDRGNAIYSFLEKFGHTSDELVDVSKPETWSYRYIAINSDKIKAKFQGIETDPLFDRHVENAKGITNALVNAFAHNKWVDAVMVSYETRWDSEANERTSDFVLVNQKPTHIDKISHKLKDGIDTAIFSQVGEQVSINPTFLNDFSERYNFKRSGNGNQIAVLDGTKNLMTIKLEKGNISVKLSENASKDDLARALRMMGMKLDAKAINVFWTEKPPLNNVIQSNLDYNFTKQRLANITGTMMLASKTLLEKSYRDSPIITETLATILNTDGSNELDADTSGNFNTPSPADFYRMVNQLAVAQSASIGEKYKNRYFTADGKTAYSIVPTDTGADDFGGGSIAIDASTKKSNEATDIINEAIDNGTINDLVRRNGNFFIENGQIQIGNQVLTTDPNYHLHVGERFEVKGVKNKLKGAAYGKTATAKDIANIAFTPWLKSVKSNSKVQFFPILSPTRADSVQAELHYIYFPVEKLTDKQGKLTQEAEQMVHNMIRRQFNNHYRESVASLNRWQDYLRTKGIMLTDKDMADYSMNPYQFNEFFNQIIAPKIANLNTDIVEGNSGLYENKDYVIKNGKVQLGYATLFNSEINSQGEIKYRDTIFNYKNFAALKNSEAYIQAAIEQYNEDPSEENEARVEETQRVYQEVFKSTYRDAYFDMVKTLKEFKYEIPEEIRGKGYASKDTPTEYNVAGIKFIQSNSSDYRVRTKENAKADATIHIAGDFTTPGEKVTKKAVNDAKKKYIPVDLKRQAEITPELVKYIVTQLNLAKAKSLNIAGNSIVDLADSMTQEQADEFTTNLLNAVLTSPDLQNKITSIVTGGQTGFDEAGAKAGAALGISTTVNAPQGYKFRNEKNKDVMDRNRFISRFGDIAELEDEKNAKWVLNPFFESFFLLNQIAATSFYEAQLGSMNQYKNIIDFFKRDKEGPGTGPETDSKAGLPKYLNNVVIGDFDNWHHTQLEKLYPELGSLDTPPTDGLQFMAPTTRMELLTAFGGDYSQIGNGQGKYNVRYYDIKEGVFKYIKSSTMHFTEDILSLASTQGHDHLENKNNYFEDTLKRMYSETLYNQLNTYRQAMPFNDAVKMLLKDIQANPELRKEVNDFITFKSAYKSASKIINRGDLSFNELVSEPLDTRYIRHQVNTDQETTDSKASSLKQFFALSGLLGHNKNVSDTIDRAQLAKARSIMDEVNFGINATQGVTPKDKFHNYLKQIGLDAANSMKDYGVIAQALTTPGISLEPSLLRNKVIQSFVKRVSKAIRFKSSGIRLVHAPGLFHVYDGTDGNVYTLTDIKAMPREQQDSLGLTTNPGRVMHTDRMENGEMLPAEVLGTYIHKNEFGLAENETINDAMSIHLKDGQKIRFDQMDINSIKKFISKNENNIDIKATPALRSGEDVEEWIRDFKNSLIGVKFRVPSHGPGSGQLTKHVGFISDYSSILFSNPLKNILDGSDYDADQVSQFTFTRGQAEDNVLLQAMVDYFSNTKNHRIINSPLSTKEEEQYADTIKEKMTMQPYSLSTSLKMYKANNDGKQIIDRLAMAGKLYGFAYKAMMNNKTSKAPLPALFKGFNLNEQAVDNYGIFVNDVTAKFLQLALDNAKLQVLGIIGANPESINTLLGIIFSDTQIPTNDETINNKFKQIADFFIRPHVKNVFDWAQNSKSIDDKTKKVWKIADVKIANLKKILAGMNIEEMVAIRKSQIKEQTNTRVVGDTEYTTEVSEKRNNAIEDAAQLEIMQMYDDAQGDLNDIQSKIDDLELLKQFDKMGEAFTRMNNMLRLDSKGIPTKDYERYNMLYGGHGIEFTIGAPLKEYFKDGGKSFIKDNPEWFMTEFRKSLPEKSEDKWTVTYTEELEREKEIRQLINYGNVLSSLPLSKEYVKMAKDVDDRISSNFIINGELQRDLMKMQLNNLGYDDWKSSQQFYLFTREYERLILSTYFNQSNYEFASMTSKTAILDPKYNIRTTAGRSQYKREFIAWVDKYLKENPDLVEGNEFLRSINIASRGLRQYIEVPFKDSFSPDKIVSIQQSAQQLKTKEKYKFENTAGGKEMPGTPISDMSLYDAFMLYQLMQEDFSGGKMSFMDLLGASALMPSSSFINTVLAPSLENDSNLNLYDNNNNAIQKSFKNIAHDIWLEDMLSRVKELLPWARSGDLDEWKDGSGPKYFRMNKRRGSYQSEVMMTWTKEKGFMELFSTVANNNGYSIDKSTTEDAYKVTEDGLIEKQRIPTIPDEYMQNLLLGKSTTLLFPNETSYHIGSVELQEGLKGYISNVSSDRRNVTIKLVKPLLEKNVSAKISNNQNPVRLRRLDLTENKKEVVTYITGEKAIVETISKENALRQAAKMDQDVVLTNLANWMLKNDAIMSRINRNGSLMYVDPALMSTEVLETIRKNEKATGKTGGTVGGSYHYLSQNIWLNPTEKLQQSTIMHELFHNLTHDAIQFLDKNNKAEVRFNERMEMIYKELKLNTPADMFVYELSDIHEMVTNAFENIPFQEFLANTPSVLQKNNLWDNFVDNIMVFLKEAFNIAPNLIGINALSDILAETSYYLTTSEFANAEKIKNTEAFKAFYANNKDLPETIVYQYYITCP